MKCHSHHEEVELNMVYRKTEATEGRKEARRRVILDTATRLFGKHGYHATTVPMIVAEAEVSTGSFYMYFRNKEDVFNAALEELGVAVAKVFDHVKQTQPNALKRIPQGAEALFMFFAENPEQARLLIVESSGLSKRLDATRRAILSGQEEELRKIFESAPTLFSVRNPVVAARCIAGATFEAVYCWLEEDPATRMPAADVARAVARFNTKGVEKVSRLSK
jgi:TetR/AcrR family transcriptional regulator, fatty acid metabolism regulator protein